MDGTVISDTVNVASRLEGMTKLYGVPLVISESTYLGLWDREKYAVRLMDIVQVKGKKDPITVYEVFNGDMAKVRAQKMAKRKDFQTAIGYYQSQRFEEAKEMFIRCQKVYPDDAPVAMYIARCDHYLEFGWDENWDGILHMASK